MNLYSLLLLLVFTSIMASIITFIIILIKILFKNKFSASWHYYIWLLVLIRLLIPYSPKSSFSLYNLMYFSSKPAAIEQQPALQDKSTVKSVEKSLSNSITISEILNTKSNDKIATAVSNKKSPKAYRSYHIKNIICTLWLLGIGFISLYIFLSYIVFLFKIKNEPFCTKDDVNEDILIQCKSKLNIKANIPIVYSNKVNVPTLIGIIKPWIIVPPNIINNLTADEKKYIFIHELVHYKRKDILLNWIMTFAFIVYWFNPVLWLSFSLTKKDCELSCDSKVLTYLSPTEHKLYGKTLIKLMEYLNRKNMLPGTSSIISNKNIKRRIILLSNLKKQSLLWTITAVFLTVMVGCTGLTNSKTIANKNTKNTTGPIIKTNDNLKGRNKKDTVSENKDISDSNKLKEQSSTTDTKTPSISEEEFKNLIINSHINISHYYILYEDTDKDTENPIDGHYVKFVTDFTTYDSLYKYIDEKLSLTKYYTKRYINEFICSITKIIDGHYYIELFNMGLPTEDAEIISQKWDDNENKLLITSYITLADNNKYEDTVTLYYDGNWKIDSITQITN